MPKFFLFVKKPVTIKNFVGLKISIKLTYLKMLGLKWL